jgi:hypothetical protein
MPSFTVYDVEVEVDVDVEEFLDECSEREIKYLLKWLKDNDYGLYHSHKNLTAGDELLLRDIQNMYSNFMRLTEEQIQSINLIAKSL